MFYVIHLLLASLLLSLLVKDNDKAIGRRASSYNLHLHFTLSRCVCISFVLFYENTTSVGSNVTVRI